jgi:hypothetical protein
VRLRLPRKRTLLAFHRWLGFISVIFLFVLALTGLALNHSERLGLHSVTVRSSMLLGRYGMASGADITSYRIHETDTISHLDGRLYYNGAHLVDGGPPVGIYQGGQDFSVVVLPEQLVYLTGEGEFIERIEASQLPWERVLFLARDAAGDPVLAGADKRWKADAEWLEFIPHAGAFEVSPLEPDVADGAVEAAILAAHQGEGLSLYRILLDLHSGRLFGWGGRTVMDLTAVAILLLVSSGIAGWLRKSRWGPWNRY